jgi:hypothetical protein
VLFTLVVFASLMLLDIYPLRRQGYRALRWPPFESPYSFDPARSQTFRGGARVGLTNSTLGLVTLTIDERHASLRGLMIVPTGVDRRYCTGVRRIGGVIGKGVRFDSADGRYDGVIFWTGNPQAVLETLRSLGWPMQSKAPASSLPFK